MRFLCRTRQGPGSRTTKLAMQTGASIALLLAATDAGADVTISSAATSNMSCGAGVCSPTAADAVLNAGDLESLLSAGSVDVITSGTGVEADDIRVVAPLGWSSTVSLTLDAHRSVIISQPVSVAGTGALSVVTNDGGARGVFSIGGRGNIQFEDPASTLMIDGENYTLVDSVATLASAVAANPSSNFALSESYDASVDGTYTSSPVPTTFYGTLDGLGNTISHLSINAAKGRDVGLFSYVYASGGVQHLRLEHLKIIATGKRQLVGGVAGQAGILYEDEASGTIKAGDGSAGGLAGAGENISSSHSSVRVIGKGIDASVGSLVGQMDGPITNSYATGDVIGTNGGCIGGLSGDLSGGDAVITSSFAMGEAHVAKASTQAAVGGLVGCGNGEITDSYATGAAISRVPKNAKKPDINVGGLVGGMVGTVSNSYSTGHVHASAESLKGGYGIYKGGLVGTVQENGSQPFTDTYWDMTTSKITNPDQGSSNDWPGITGLTTEQLQSGLPSGFDPKIWTENPAVNNGLPYLRHNPPPK